MRVASASASRCSAVSPAYMSPLPPGSIASTICGKTSQSRRMAWAWMEKTFGIAIGDGRHERHRAVPHVVRVLHARDGLQRAPAPSEDVAVGPVVAVHLGREHPRVAGHRGAGAVAGERPVLSRERVQPAHVRLDQVGAAVHRELDRAGDAVEEPERGRVLDARHREHRVEEPALVALGRREVDREPGVGPLEARRARSGGAPARRATRRRRRTRCRTRDPSRRSRRLLPSEAPFSLNAV